MNLRFTALSCLFLILFTNLIGCKDHSDRLLVFSAASLADALGPIGQTFTHLYDLPVDFSFGGSTALARQLLRGAPADVFISAGSDPIQLLHREQPQTRTVPVDLLTNKLVLVGRSQSKQLLTSPTDLLKPNISKIAIADPALAPAGRYAQIALQNLHIWEPLEEKLIFGANVRTTLAYLDGNYVDAAIVYQSDVTHDSPFEILLEFNPELHPKITYQGVVLNHSTKKSKATSFVQFLRSEEVQEMFSNHGFIPSE